MKVLFLPLYSITAPSTRHRVYVYLRYLNRKGVRTRVHLPLKVRHPRKDFFYYLYKPFYSLSLWVHIFLSDIIFIQKLILSPFLERYIRFLKKRVVFDFDDAIFVKSPDDAVSRKEGDHSPGPKVIRMIKLARYVLVSNSYLRDFSMRYNKNTVVFYNSLDTHSYHPEKKNKKKTLTLGWVGTHVNLFYLKKIEKALIRVFEKFKGRLLLEIIADRLTLSLHPAIKIAFTKWSLKKELDNLRHFDIGLSPNSQDRWSRGKSSFKALQYMGLGIPTVCSRIGFFPDLFRDKQDILYADTEKEWISHLTALIRNRPLREKMGRNSYLIVKRYFSAEKNAEKMAEIFRSIS